MDLNLEVIVIVIVIVVNGNKMSGAISQQKKYVEQLRVESNIRRVPASEAIKDLIRYTEEHKDHDPLIVGIDKKQNPFMEKTSCAIL